MELGLSSLPSFYLTNQSNMVVSGGITAAVVVVDRGMEEGAKTGTTGREGKEE